MIVFGNPTLLQYVEDKVGTNFVVFNFNELIENVQSLNYLNPYFGAVYNTNNSVFVNEQAFDQFRNSNTDNRNDVSKTIFVCTRHNNI